MTMSAREITWQMGARVLQAMAFALQQHSSDRFTGPNHQNVELLQSTVEQIFSIPQQQSLLRDRACTVIRGSQHSLTWTMDIHIIHLLPCRLH